MARPGRRICVPQDVKNLTFEVYGASAMNLTLNSGYQSIKYTQAAGSTVLKFGNEVIVLLLDQPTAWYFWAPSTSKYPSPRPDETIFILGPYSVHSASSGNQVLQVSALQTRLQRLSLCMTIPGGSLRTRAARAVHMLPLPCQFSSARIMATTPEQRCTVATLMATTRPPSISLPLVALPLDRMDRSLGATLETLP